MSDRAHKHSIGFKECAFSKRCWYDAQRDDDHCYYHAKVRDELIDAPTVRDTSASLPRLLREWDIGLGGINLDG